MRTFQRRATSVTIALAVLAWQWHAARLADGAKPGGGGGGGSSAGTIFFEATGWGFAAMNADGSNKASLASNLRGEPSRQLHAAHRWFLQWGGYQDASGIPHATIQAIRDDGELLPLLDQADLRITELHWGPADAGLIFVGQSAAASAIFAAPLVFDGGGNLIGLDVQGTLPLVDLFAPALQGFDWSPDGASVVYADNYALFDDNDVLLFAHRGLFVTDLVTGLETCISDNGFQPRWSPDGTRIAFAVGLTSVGWDVVTTAPDGSNLKTVAAGRAGGSWIQYRAPEWSPNGSQLVCRRIKFSGGFLPDTDIVRVSASGGSVTNLTSDIPDDAGLGIWGWR